MHMITYISDYKGDKAQIDKNLSDIITKAQQKNKALGVTGVLFYLNGQFLQIIEGEDETIKNLMAEITIDDRHTNVSILIDEKVEQRGFKDFNMDTFNLEKDTDFNRDKIEKLTENFKQNFIPRTDILIHFYKSLLAKV